jgi:hypothetical protein
MKYIRTYHMLVVHGHHPTKAAEIIVNAKRRDAWSLRWIRRVHSMQHPSLWIERKHSLAGYKGNPPMTSFEEEQERAKTPVKTTGTGVG